MKVYTKTQLAELIPAIPTKKTMKKTKQYLGKKLSKVFKTSKVKKTLKQTTKQLIDDKTHSVPVATKTLSEYHAMWQNGLKSTLKSLKNLSYVAEASAGIGMIQKGFNYDPSKHAKALSSQIKIAYFEKICDVSSLQILAAGLRQFSIHEICDLLQSSQKLYWMGDHFSTINNADLAYLGDF